MGKPANGTVAAWVAANKDYAGDGCLLWPFARLPDGRAAVSQRLGSSKAARVMCRAAHGNPPPRHEAAHSCGKGHEGCINPRHLRWATPTDNQADKIAHGTTNRGERHGMARLTAPEVLAIRSIAGRSQSDIAKEFGVSRRTVGFIQTKQRWAWL